MKKLLLTLMLPLFGLALQAQDFKIIDYTKGYEQEHAPDKKIKIQVLKKATPLTVADFNKDGIMDTIIYKLSMGGGQTATIQVFDPKADDWIYLYKMSLSNFGGEDGLWFYQINTPEEPRLLTYTARTGNKFVTIFGYDAVGKKYVTKEYKLNPKNLFPHKYVVNKRKLWNHSGANSSEKDAYEEIVE